MNDSILQLKFEHEAEWKTGRRPDLRALLRPALEEYRERLFSELLDAEITYRRQLLGQSLQEIQDELSAEFPEFTGKIEEAFSLHPSTELETVENIVGGPIGAEAGGDETLDSAQLANQADRERTALFNTRTVPEGNRSSASKKPARFDDYELIDEIARGGMGVVYKARQISLNRIVALKMILAGEFASRDDVRRFYVEAEAAAKLNHAGIVPIFEIGESNGQHYFSMGFIEGSSLAEVVKQGPLEAKQAAEMCAKICEAVDYAHRSGVVHRDLKPANVLLDASGQPKVTDFGLAKQSGSDSDLTRTGAVMGTPSYMPPEQASGKLDEVGPLSDIYSIGAILYCLLTGRPPFQAANPIDTLKQVLEKDPVPLQTLNPSVPRDLEVICLKCLHKSAGKRYQTAQELAEDLGRFLRRVPILARPIGNVERTTRWIARHPASAMLLATGTVLLLTVLFGGYGLIDQQRKMLAVQDSAEKDRFKNLAESTLTADIAYIPSLLSNSNRSQAGFKEALSFALVNKAEGTSEFRKSFLNYILDETGWDALVAVLDKASPQEIMALQEYLTGESLEPNLDELWERLTKTLQLSASGESPLPYASILATLDPHNERWPELSSSISDRLIQANSLNRAYWSRTLKPLAKHITPSLFAYFDRQEEENSGQSAAAELLAVYAADNPELLSRVIGLCEGPAFETILASLRAHPEQAKQSLQTIASQPKWKEWPELDADQIEKPLTESLMEKVKAFDGQLLSGFGYCHQMPLHESESIVSELANSGYRLTRFRPYLFKDQVLVAAVWQQDQKTARFAYDKSPDQLQNLEKEYQQQGFVPVDTAGYLSSNDQTVPMVTLERYAAVWEKDDGRTEDEKLVQYSIRAGLTPDELDTIWSERGGSLGLIHAFRSFREPTIVAGSESDEVKWADHEIYSIVTSSQLENYNYSNRGIEQLLDYQKFDDFSNVSVVSRERIHDPKTEAQRYVHLIKNQSISSEALADSLNEVLWQAYMGTGNFDLAIKTLNPLIESLEKEIQPVPDTLVNHYGYRALAHALAGNEREALADIARVQRFCDNSDTPTWAIFPSILYACLGDEENMRSWASKLAAVDDSKDMYEARYQVLAATFAWAAKYLTQSSEKYTLLMTKALDKIRLYDFGTRSITFGRDFDGFFDSIPLKETVAYRTFAAKQKINHLYNWDRVQNATFESQIVTGLPHDETPAKYTELNDQGFRMVCISSAEIDGQVICASVWHRPRSTETDIERREKARARSAIALCKMGYTELWPQLFDNSDDQRGNAYLVEAFSDLHVEPKLVLDLLRVQATNPHHIRTLLLALGSYPEEDLQNLPSDEPVALFEKFRSHRNSGIHSAAVWAARELGLQLSATQATDTVQSSESAHSDSSQAVWSLGPLGLEFAHIPAGEFLGGSDSNRDPDYTGDNEEPVYVVIPKALAISTTTITKSIYQQFMNELLAGLHPEIAVDIRSTPTGEAFLSGFMDRVVRTDDSPVTSMPWTGACLFCNWLSKKSGIPKEDWFYVVNANTTEILDRRTQSNAFRLPFQYEWEYAARAGTKTRRFFGYSEELLPEYGWYVANSQNRTWPVGLKKPNPNGLFDVYGNVWEWCDEGSKRGGGCYDGGPFWMRSAQPQGGGIHDGTGFRVARTLTAEDFLSPVTVPQSQPVENDNLSQRTPLQETGWFGTIDLGPRVARYFIRPIAKGNSSQERELLSLDEGQQIFLLENFEVTDTGLRFDLPKTGVHYEGQFSPDKARVNGMITQFGQSTSLILTSVMQLPAEETPTEHWTGAIEGGSNYLAINMKSYAKEDGTELIILDVPAQQIGGLKCLKQVSGDTWTLTVEAVLGKFEGKLDQVKGEIKGVWTQNGVESQMSLKRM